MAHRFVFAPIRRSQRYRLLRFGTRQSFIMNRSGRLGVFITIKISEQLCFFTLERFEQ